MKKKIIGILVIGTVVFLTFRAGMVAGASSSEPGSTSDPLITQSYLEKRLKEINSGSVTSNTQADEQTTTQTVESSYKKLSVTKGKKLIVSEGSEFVVYSGESNVVGEKGLLNLSDGYVEEMDNSVALYQNYLSLSASSGIKATTSCVIYVKGSYTIQG